MVVTKSQIRPRRKKIRLSNAEILTLDATGFFQLIPAAPLGCALVIFNVQFRLNLVQVYGGIDATPFLIFFDDYTVTPALEDDAMAGINAFTAFFANGFGPLVLSEIQPGGQLQVDGNSYAVPAAVSGWTDFATLQQFGGIYMTFSNGGTEMTGGDPDNYLDIFLSYNIINL